MSDRRFQVFVSSTYTDLIEERRLVTEQLLRARCIPAGMELFTASGMAPWDVIRSALDTTDYLVLIIAGRYGSTIDQEGIGYTEREYDYAVDKGIPVLAFLHATPGRLPSDEVDTGRLKKKLDAFIKKVRDTGRHTIETWTDSYDLASKVSTAVIRETLTQPRPGWVRGDAVKSDLPPPLAASEDVSQILRAPGGSHRAERMIETQVAALRKIPELSPSIEVNAVGDIGARHAERLTAILKASESLVTSIATAAREGNEELDRAVVDTVIDLSDISLRGGYTALVHLAFAPAVLAFHAAGLGACAGRRDSMIGRLLSDRSLCIDMSSGNRYPLASSLNAGRIWPSSTWPNKQLFVFLSKVLVTHEWPEFSILRAWEKWQFMTCIAGSAYRGGGAPSPSWPYLRFEAGYGHDSNTIVGRQIIADLEQGQLSPIIFELGFCSGDKDRALTLAREFEDRYARWGNEEDWKIIGPGGSDTNRSHYPGGG